MQLKQLELYRFRNLLNQTIAFPSRVTLVSGKNGQGKTSLLEAVFFLAHAKSFREPRSRELIRWPGEHDLPSRGEPQQSRLKGMIESADGEKEIECRLSGSKNTAYLNGSRIERAGSFYGQLACVVFTPDELQLVKGPPHGRRAFLDRIFAAVDRTYVETSVQYQRAVKSRNSVLASARELGYGPQQLRRELDPWSRLAAVHGVEIVSRRLALLGQLTPKVVKYYKQLLGPEGAESVDAVYESRLAANGEAVTAEQAEEMLDECLQRDLARKATSLGPHRDDIELLLEADFGRRSARVAASQGQARSLALSLKMAAIDFLFEKLGEPPVVLLDDVESELDRSRKGALYGLVSEFSSQVIITATEISPLLVDAVEDPYRLTVSAGEIRPG